MQLFCSSLTLKFFSSTITPINLSCDVSDMSGTSFLIMWLSLILVHRKYVVYLHTIFLHVCTTYCSNQGALLLVDALSYNLEWIQRFYSTIFPRDLVTPLIYSFPLASVSYLSEYGLLPQNNW